MKTADAPGTLPPRVLTIAGSDSGGGAGIQADIKVITCLGGYAMSAITALTAQDTRGVWGVHPVPPEFVAQQVELCLSDIGADAIKTGMLCNAAIVRAVAAVLRKHLSVETGAGALVVKDPDPVSAAAACLVVDPVMFSKSAHRLLDEAAERAMIEEILPLATVVTPNLPEAGRLAGFEVRTVEEMRRAAVAIHKLGPRAVLVKGGHLGMEGHAPSWPQTSAGVPPFTPEASVARDLPVALDSVMDLLYDGRDFLEFPGQRLASSNTHGTGCSFSSALATELARGRSLPEAARRAKQFITEAIRHSLALGHGCGPTNPLAAARAIESTKGRG